MRIRALSVVACAGLLLAARSTLAASTTIATSGESYVTHDSDQSRWVVGNTRLQLLIGADPGLEFTLLRVVIPTAGESWSVAGDAESIVTIDGERRRVGRKADGFRVSAVSASTVPNGVQLDVQMELAGLDVGVTRHYVVYDGSPTAEVWTTVTSSAAAAHTLADLNAFSLTVPAGTIRWMNGLQGDNPGAPKDGAFTLRQRDLGDGEQLALGAVGRSSEQDMPWVVVEGSQQSFFAGLMWSGSWTLEMARAGAAVAMTGGLASMSTVLGPSATVDSPHAFFGVVPGNWLQVGHALHPFALNGVRAGRPLEPLVTYNTWYSHGVRFDENDLRAEMGVAAAFGAELFVVDAGWYVGILSGGSVSDFEPGLGNWNADPARFPSGLHALTDYAHQLGLKLGLWVEPERVSRETVGRPGLAEEAWLATVNGEYRSPTTAQICFASPAARNWVLSQLIRLIDDVQPDYLKWDNNFWVNCARDGHGHGPTDGNYAHVHGLYEVLATLRARYPALLIENVSGGGNRLDLGMLRYSDVGWMDDRTAPSIHVRHNVEALSEIFPPAYLLSFVVDHESEPLHNSADLALPLRSRMIGALGFSLRAGQFTDGELATLTREIAVYKALRDTLAGAGATLLTPQATADRAPAWDALQVLHLSGTSAVISAFQSDTGVTKTNVKPLLLDPGATYEIRSVDSGLLGTATGSDLMTNGIDVWQSPNSAAHILVITRVGAVAQRVRP